MTTGRTKWYGHTGACACAIAMLLFGGSVRAEGETAGDVHKPTAEDAAADQQFERGVQEFERGAHAEAYGHLRRSFELDPHFKTAAVLGQTTMALGRAAEAATWFAWTLHNMPSGEAPGVRSKIQVELDRLKPKTIEVMVQCLAPAALSIDGVACPWAMTNGTRIYLEPGKHELVLKSEGSQSFATQVEGGGGSTTTVTVPLPVVEPPAPVTTDPVSVTAPTIVTGVGSGPSTDVGAPQTPSWLLPGAIVTGAAALGAAGLGTFWYLRAIAAEQDIASATGELRERGPVPCSPDASSVPPECQDLTEYDQDRVWSANASTVAFVGAGVFAVASAGLWVWLWNSDSAGDVTVSYSGASGVHQVLLRGSL